MTPLDPYLRSHLIRVLMQAYRPRDLIVPPEETFQSDSMAYLVESSLIRGWVSRRLKYVRWYYTVAAEPGLSLQDFFDAPIVARHWKVSSEDPHLIRFGLMWRLFDEVARWRLSPKYYVLEECKMVHHTILYGGISGQDFLVYASRLNQPRAGRGHIPVGYYDDAKDYALEAEIAAEMEME